MTDTDRELLEFAAKAAGKPHKWCEVWKTMAIPLPDGGFQFESTWNPLHDKGYALELAVALDIWPVKENNLILVQNGCAYWDILVECEIKDDACAVVCRAIVMAAAEIGRNME